MAMILVYLSRKLFSPTVEAAAMAGGSLKGSDISHAVQDLLNYGLDKTVQMLSPVDLLASTAMLTSTATVVV